MAFKEFLDDNDNLFFWFYVGILMSTSVSYFLGTLFWGPVQ